MANFVVKTTPEADPPRTTREGWGSLAKASGRVRVFDINLRQSFYSGEIIRQSLDTANALKLNDDEFPVVADLIFPSLQSSSCKGKGK